MIDSLNTAAEHWWPYVLHATWQATLVAAIALAVVFAFRRLPAPWRYALLLVALVKFAFPPVVAWKYGLFYATGPAMVMPETDRPAGRVQIVPPTLDVPDATPSPAAMPAAPADTAGDVSSAQTAEASPAAAPPPRVAAQPAEPRPGLWQAALDALSRVTWKAWLMILHGCGSLAVLVYIAIGLRQLIRLNRGAERIADGPLHETVARLRKRLDMDEDVELLISEEDIPPFAYWLLRPKVLLPRTLVDSLNPAGLETVLAHEIVHHRRNDWAANFLQLLMAAAWWFNPAIFLLNRALTDTREQCCDDALLGLELTDARSYCDTLINTAERITQPQPLGTTLGFAERLHPMANRIKRITDKTLNRAPKLSSGAMVATALLCIAILPGGRSEAEKVATADNAVFREVRIIDKVTGSPIAEAQILAQSQNGTFSATTSAMGLANIQVGIEQPIYVKITTVAEGYADVVWYYQSRESQIELPEVIEIKCEPAVVIGGVVIDEAGAPVEYAKVAIRSNGTSVRDGIFSENRVRAEVVTNSEGRWHYSRSPKELATLSYNVSHSEYVSDEFASPRPRPADELLLRQEALFVVKRGLTLAGQVLDELGQPVVGARVTLSDNFRVVNTHPWTTTNEKGEFKIGNLAEGNEVVTVTAAGFGPYLSEVSVTESTEPLEIVLGQGRTIEIKVIDNHGDPISEGHVWMLRWRTHRSVQITERINAEGRVTFRDAPLESFQVEAAGGKGYEYRFGEVIPADVTEHTITLLKSSTVSGTVVDKETSKPIQDFTVLEGWIRPDFPVVYWDRLNKHILKGGEFLLEDLDVREGDGFGLRFEAKGYRAAEFRFDDPANLPQTINVEMSRAESVPGRVVRDDGTAVAEAQIVLGTAQPNGIQITNGRITGDAGSTVLTESAADGTFTLPPEPGVNLVLITHEDGWAKSTINSLKENADVPLRSWARIEGELHGARNVKADESFTLLFLTKLDMRGDVPRVVQQCTGSTDERGRFQVERVLPHDWERMDIHTGDWRGPDSVRQTIDVELKSGVTSTVRIGATGASVVGRLVRVDGVSAGVRNATMLDIVSVPGTPYFWMRVYAAPDGSFAFHGVPVGEYVLNYSELSGTQVSEIAHAKFHVRDRSLRTVDLGNLEIRSLRKLSVGTEAPELLAATGSNHVIRLSELRGQFIFVSVFTPASPDAGPTRATLEGLDNKFGPDGSVRLLSIVRPVYSHASYPSKENPALPGLSFLMSNERTNNVFEYIYSQVERGRPTNYLIDRDGRIIAMGVPLDKLESVIADALGE